MATSFGASIKIDGSLNAAVAAAPKLPETYTRKLPVPWSPERYEAVILGLLQTLQSSVVGKAVMAQLARRLTIRPYIWTPENALAIPLTRLHATELDASTHCKDDRPEVTGTGNGTSVTIWITPANRAIPDATMLHEMVHAMRMMQGALTCDAYGGNFDREEEYHAILLTNIFMSEQGRKLIRLNHTGKSWVDATSPWDQFRVDPFLIMTFGMRHSTLAMEIGRAKKAKFNPFNPAFSDKMRVRPY